jgi:hypothetical protein
MKIKLLCCWLVSLKQGTQISPATVRSVYAPRTYYHTLYAERTVPSTIYASRTGTRVPTVLPVPLWSATQDFRTAFEDQGTQVIDAFQINAKQRVGAIESFALSITSHAQFTNST